jgi:7-carboxy-7-deazaguanine synthase
MMMNLQPWPHSTELTNTDPATPLPFGSPQQDDVLLTDADAVAPVQEVFSSYQGEGPCVGQRQVFVRFAHCHLKCQYCDTPMHSPDGLCHISLPGQTQPQSHNNPLAVATLVQAIQQWVQHTPHHSVSFTGGEPLLYHRFLAHLLPQVQPMVPVYLETSGTQPDFLSAVLPWVDVIAMDVKLPSATGEGPQWQAHRQFLQLALQRQVFLKLVFNNTITAEEIEATGQLAELAPHVPLILQPETSLTHSPQVHVSESTLFTVAEALRQRFTDVRVIPQTHKMLMLR